ncbi:MAG: hypothetical protein ACR2QA_07665 [Solirubrobacteraceae bacterium]
MVLLRPLTRLIGAVWALALGLLGLGIALYCLDGLVSLGSARPDRPLGLVSVRRHVGHFLDQVAARGPIAGLALLCGVGAMLIGVVLLVSTISSRRQRLAVLERDAQGTLAARPRILRAMAGALAEQARGATSVKRPKISLSRRGTRGRLTVNASRAGTSNPKEVQRAVQDAVAPIGEPFKLKSRVRVRIGERGARVQ